MNFGLSNRKIVASACLALAISARGAPAHSSDGRTTTPISHLIVILQENVSFDHYFATYPHAANLPGEPMFKAQRGTPPVNGLSAGLLNNNPNSFQPFRLSRSQQLTCNPTPNYTFEQEAYHGGLLDRFPEYTGQTSNTTPPCEFGLGRNVVMGFYDGNTVTALWNYAQHFAMSDNFFGTTFGKSAAGHINFISGQTHGVMVIQAGSDIDTVVVEGTVIGEAITPFDDCGPKSGSLVAMTGTNVGDLLNARNVTWGWFAAGFTPTSTTSQGTAICNAQHASLGGIVTNDYLASTQPFQRYRSTANPHHLAPSSIAMIGYTDQANHQYDLSDFWTAADAGKLPAVSFLTAPQYQNGHGQSSTPLDEQSFLVSTINRLQNLREWESTAVIITYDDSGGLYDHVMPPIVSQSNTAFDALNGPGSCGAAAPGAYQGRCGYGPRLPFIVISPWAKANFVDHGVTDQTSILRFIEDNWKLERIGDQSFDERAGSSKLVRFWVSPGTQVLPRPCNRTSGSKQIISRVILESTFNARGSSVQIAPAAPLSNKLADRKAVRLGRKPSVSLGAVCAQP